MPSREESPVAPHRTGLPYRVPGPVDDVAFTPADVEQSIAARFSEQVRLHGTRRAVKTDDADLTYQAFNDAANRVAHTLLRRLPWRPFPPSDNRASLEDVAEPVPVLIGQGVPALVSMFGVLKAGKVYVPLEPSDPHTRLAFILGDLSARVLLTTRTHADLARRLAPEGCTVLLFEDIDASLLPPDPDLPIPPHAPVSVVYTSGSTAHPRGVLHTQRSLLHDTMVKTQVFGVRPHDRLSLLTSGTGQAIKNVTTALLNGASLYPYAIRQQGLTGLAPWLIRERITVCNAPAPVFRNFVDLLRGDESFPDLRLIRLGSDTVYPEDLRRFKRHFASTCVLANLLSSTETATICAYVMDQASELTDAVVPVGFPISGADVLLLDENDRPVGPGEVGTIAVRSPSLAAGYWRRPDLTRATFLANDAEGTPRLFRSGDLGYRLPSGALVHAGRRDARVKIRGYRVHTTEVEAALLAHENVRSALVVAHKDDRGERLVGYIVPKTMPGPTTSDLRRFLAERLADHMIPAVYVPMTSLPLLPSGKLDRRSLPPPGRARPVLDVAYSPPRTPIEEALTDIWARVLDLECVGIHDAFFDLGGDSLVASRILARVFQALGVEVSLRVFFETPTIAMLGERITALRSSSGRTDRPDAMVHRPAAGPCDLSWGQQRLWLIHQLDPDSPAYNMPAALHIDGPLNRVALQEAVEHVVRRHDVLRTTYVLLDGSPRAVARDAGTVSLPLVDLSRPSERSAHAREDDLLRRIHAETERPFDLSRDPVIRFVLFRLAPERHVLFYVNHHIASDRWSQGLLRRELAILYEAFAGGSAAPLPPLPIQYADFARWQRGLQDTENYQRQLAYWKAHLAELPPPAALPMEHPRPAVQSFRGACHRFHWPADLTRRLGDLAREENATLFMVLLAGFQTLVHRYTGQDEIVVGCPISGRNRVETESLVGFFVNTLVLRTDFAGIPSFRNVLRRVRERALSAYANADVPFEKLVEVLQQDRDLGRNPLFQIAFDVFVQEETTADAANVRFIPMPLDRHTAPLDQSWNLAVTGEGLHGRVEFNADLFDAATVERMADHLERLLQAVLEAPDRPIGEQPLLTPPEREQVLVGWNRTEAPYPDETCFHTLVEDQAARTPTAIALSYAGETCTYEALNRKANRIAHALHRRGVGQGVPVGLCVDRSPDLVAGMLGILKAGGVYLPLDPSYPSERLRLLCEDAAPPVILADPHLAAVLPDAPAEIVAVDDPSLVGESTLNPGVTVRPEHPAYILFTSGSTGRPKGVVIRHRGLCNLAEAQHRLFELSASSRVLQFASMSFDASIWEIAMALTTGARLCLAPADALAPGPPLLRTLRHDGITHCTLPPSVLALLPADDLPALHTVIAAGEPCPPAVAARWSSGRSFFNAYGPTETTVCATVARCTESSGRTPPIGYPIANMQVYVLDERRHPVPIGVPGELYVGGVGLAEGYLKRPDETAKRFIPNPFGTGRLYRTGDQVRHRPDGALVFLGRLDDQIILRGFRIEPGEVESLLLEQPGVREAAVTVRKETEDHPILVAYVVPKESASPGVLRRHLKRRAPDYMIPGIFVGLDALPRTASGKIDRAALPSPSRVPSGRDAVTDVPGTPLTEFLAGIWTNLLTLDSVGLNDDFFEIGGHSLLATQVVARISEDLHIDLPLRVFFEAPTIARLAEALRARSTDVHRLEQTASLCNQVAELSDDEVQTMLKGLPDETVR